MNICVFDTETTSLTKPFCYNIGYVITDTETGENLVEKDFVVEQVWHNPALFCSAYYADKRPIYVQRMRARKTIMNKYGYICQEMIRDFEKFDVSVAYAYNSAFDEKVFNFNCDWYKCNNPFDNVQIIDIMGNVHNKFAFTDDFKKFCDEHEYYTDSGNYSTTAETIYKYLFDENFTEEHTALSDSKIEKEILAATVDHGCEIGVEYKRYNSIPRITEKTLEIVEDKTNHTTFKYVKMVKRGDKIYLTTKIEKN